LLCPAKKQTCTITPTLTTPITAGHIHESIEYYNPKHELTPNSWTPITRGPDSDRVSKSGLASRLTEMSNFMGSLQHSVWDFYCRNKIKFICRMYLFDSFLLFILMIFFEIELDH
ncbi:hypothetical protein, partial [Vibrio vulnificus]|uniref:hypothetical protein n=1 Tax=Vibrio vulnificus TaxID=672 RepID=UPI001EEBA890